MKRVRCKVVSVSPILDDIFNVELHAETPQDFAAGQYLQVVMAEDDKRPFSIASAPQQKQTLELHIGAPADNPYARQVVDKLQQSGDIEIELPFGHAQVDVASDKPILIMVGGTGFSYAKSIIDYLLESGARQDIYLYWGGRNMGGLYLHEQALHWQEQGQIHYVPCLEQAVPQWQGRRGLVHQAVLEDFTDMSQLEVYIAGRFEMAGVARDAFLERGLPLQQLHGDAFDFI